MKVIFILTLLAFVSCGADDDDGLSSRQQEDSFEKSIFSVWINRDDNSQFDLSRASFETPSFAEFKSETGATCSCSVFLRGEESQGTLEVFNCTGVPECDAEWENGRRPYEFINAERILELCEAPGVCETYR